MAQTLKPANLSVNARPIEGYVLVVDGKLKTKYDTPEAAAAAATQLKISYPVIQTAVYDAAAGTYTNIGSVTRTAEQKKHDDKKEEQAT
jgi:hypothetical protein